MQDAAQAHRAEHQTAEPAPPSRADDEEVGERALVDQGPRRLFGRHHDPDVETLRIQVPKRRGDSLFRPRDDLRLGMPMDRVRIEVGGVRDPERRHRDELGATQPRLPDRELGGRPRSR